MKGKPHAFAWNIGTTGRHVSRSEIPSVPACVAASEWIASARCEYRTPFGWPVVPLV